MTVSAGGHRYSIDDPILIDGQSLTAFHQYASSPLRCGYPRRCADLLPERRLKPLRFSSTVIGRFLLKPMMQRNDERGVKLYVRLHPPGAGIMMRGNP